MVYEPKRGIAVSVDIENIVDALSKKVNGMTDLQKQADKRNVVALLHGRQTWETRVMRCSNLVLSGVGRRFDDVTGRDGYEVDALDFVGEVISLNDWDPLDRYYRLQPIDWIRNLFGEIIASSVWERWQIEIDWQLFLFG